MTKHIHIHLHRGAVVRDAERTYVRSANGEFATSGSSGGDAAHHEKQAKESTGGSKAKFHHEAAAKALAYSKSTNRADERRWNKDLAQEHADSAAYLEKSHHRAGGEVFTTHRNTPTKATYIGPDSSAGKNHHEIKVGNSRVSVPEHDLHPSREAAHRFNQTGKTTSDAGFDEAKHKRDHGKFASVQGSGDPGFHKSGLNSSPAMRHHDEAEGHHHAAAQAEYAKNGKTPLHEAHKAAAQAHSHALAEAKNKAQGYESGYESSAKKAAEASAKTMPAAPSPAAKPQANSSGVPVKHQPSGTTVPHQAPKYNPQFDKPKPGAKEPSDAEMKAHPNYNKEDHDYFKEKGWTNSEIHQRWTAENGAGKPAQQVNKFNAPAVRYDNGNRPIK